MLKFVIASFILCTLSIPSFAARMEVPSEKTSNLCELCTLVLGTAQSLLEQNKTEDEVLQFIEKNLCGRLGPINATCVQYMETEGREILYELSQKIDPSIVCHKIGLCAVPKTEEIPKPKKVKSGPLCELCTLVLTAAKNLLQNNETDDQVIAFIEKELCARLGPLNGTCVNLLETTGREILADLANGLDPETVCKKFALCTSHLLKRRLAEKVAANPLECTVCQYVIQFVDAELGGNKTEAAVVATLEKVCNILPATVKTECQNLVSTYGVYLVQLIIEFADPLKVCQALKVC